MRAPVRASSRALAVVLLAALAALCVGDIVHAAMPDVDERDCASRICDEQTGCGAPQAVVAALPLATSLSGPSVPAPTAAGVLGASLELVAFSDRQVVPRAPRSPPVAS